MEARPGPWPQGHTHQPAPCGSPSQPPPRWHPRGRGMKCGADVTVRFQGAAQVESQGSCPVPPPDQLLGFFWASVSGATGTPGPTLQDSLLA